MKASQTLPRWSVFLFLAGAACVLLYYPGLSGPFLFDDTFTVVKNAWIKIGELNPLSLKMAASSFTSDGRELAMLSLAFNHYFLGPDALGYKVVNLGIHCLVGLSLYQFSRIVVARLVSAGELQSNAVFRWMPEIVAGIWLVSPINLTSVLYVSQRMTSLSALFTMAGIIVYTVWRTRLIEGRGHFWPAYPLIALCLAAAYLSKENGLLLVPFVVLVEACVFGFRTRGDSTNWKLVAALAGFFFAAVCIGAWLENFNPARLAGSFSHRTFTLEERLLTQGRVLIFYIGLILFPFHWRMGLWHDDFQTSTALFAPFDTFTSIVLLAMLLGLAIAVRRRYPLCTLGIIWFFVGHSMESSFLPLEMIHEHRNYLPAYGVLLTLVAFLGYLVRLRPGYKILVLAVLGLTASFNLHSRATAWSNEYSHALYEFTNHPSSPRASFELAVTTVRLHYHGVREAKDDAMALLRHTRELGDPTILPEAAMLLISSQIDGEYDTAWVESAASKLRASNGIVSDAVALRGLRECMRDNQCQIDRTEVLPLYEAAADTTLATTIYEAARFFFDIGDTRRALSTLERAANYTGGIDVKLNYVWALIDLNRLDEARDYVESLGYQSSSVDIRFRQYYDDALSILYGSGEDGG